MAAPSGRISLVIPCYNAAAYLGEAIASALAQSRPPDEIIVIDDGSTDDSAAVAARSGDAVRYIRKENGGDSSARNLGIRHAQGDWIAFLDADDVWPTHSLAERAEALASNEFVGFVWGTTEQFVSPDSARADTVTAPLSAAAPLQSATLFRRRAFDEVGLFDPAPRLGTMMDWYNRALHLGVRGIAIDTVVLKRRIHDRNSVHDHARLMADYLRILRGAARRNRDTAA